MKNKQSQFASHDEFIAARKKEFRKRKQKFHFVLIAILMVIGLASCFITRENYSTGERVGYVTKFSYSGLVFRGYEGELNMSQTGFNSSGAPFEFSIDVSDKKHTNDQVIQKLREALTRGVKVKLRYHESFGRNWFSHRGSTNHFIDEVTFED